MRRRIIKINEEKCTGCGICVEACHERAIEIVDGKARLVSDEYCDGLGACLPACPEKAIEIVEVEAKPFNEEAVKERLSRLKSVCNCPGAKELEIKRPLSMKAISRDESELKNWPIQMKLMNPGAKFFSNSDLLVAADCTAFAYASIHPEFMRGRVTLIGCPKLDDAELYYEKLLQIFKTHRINSVTVLRMEVPCCSGIVHIVRKAMEDADALVPLREEVITIQGKIKQKEVCHVL